jgi:hypothetical protein
VPLLNAGDEAPSSKETNNNPPQKKFVDDNSVTADWLSKIPTRNYGVWGTQIHTQNQTQIHPST